MVYGQATIRGASRIHGNARVCGEAVLANHVMDAGGLAENARGRG